jgi:glc operon protein GlcG
MVKQIDLKNQGRADGKDKSSQFKNFQRKQFKMKTPSISKFATSIATGLLMLGLSTPLIVSAQTAPAAAPAAPAAAPILPGYGVSINLEQAKKMMAAAEAHAKANNWIVGIAIVDTAAQLVAFHKMDGLQHASVGIATGKATTSVNFRRPTKALEDAIAGGGAGLRTLAIPGVMPLEGGIPIVIDGKIVGGIGVSGVLSTQDAQIARAGLDALK